MSNILSSLSAGGSALGIYQRALDVVQNNLTNSSTPGFARQTISLEAQPLDLASGLAGGVASRGLQSARDEFAEGDVRRQLQSLGLSQGQAQAASSIENLFNVSGASGIPADLSKLLQSFSAWSVDPGGANSRQNVMANAGALASGVRSLYQSLQGTAGNVNQQIASTVDQVNSLSDAIRQYNEDRLSGDGQDPALDARLHAALEQLSQLVDVNSLTHGDGTVSVTLNGGAPLVLGKSAYPISTNSAGNRVLDWQGADATDQIAGGKLGGLLDAANRVLPGLIGSGNPQGSLNRFAQSFADTVNGILRSGFVAPGAGAAQGSDLFVYDSSGTAAPAGTLAVNPSLTPDQLAPVDASGNANGNALKLASLDSSTSAGALDGMTFGGFFSHIAAGVGSESANAMASQDAQQLVVAQARTLRDQSSGVSLDQQAILLMQFQKVYQATARVITTLDQMLDTVINMVGH